MFEEAAVPGMDFNASAKSFRFGARQNDLIVGSWGRRSSPKGFDWSYKF
jgi:hypothetical protein